MSHFQNFIRLSQQNSRLFEGDRIDVLDSDLACGGLYPTCLQHRAKHRRTARQNLLVGVERLGAYLEGDVGQGTAL